MSDLDKEELEATRNMQSIVEKNENVIFKEYRNALIDMVNQFAYEDMNPKTRGSSLEKLYTGGLSALEEAFNVLEIEEGVTREELWMKKK